MLISRCHIIRKVAKMSTYQNLGDMRTKYLDNRQAFHESDLVSDNPIKQFESWFLKVKDCKQILEPNAMCLATSTKSGFPSARYVLLKGYGEQGFSFYTNKGSRKGQELAENPQAALVFYWEPFNRSVRIEGHVVETSDEESSTYFKRRPYASQIGAAASEQSMKIASRDDLVAKAKELEIKLLTGRITGADTPSYREKLNFGKDKAIASMIESSSKEMMRTHRGQDIASSLRDSKEF